MALHKGDQKNFEMLKTAFKHGDAALVECQDAKTGKYVAVICATNREDDGSVGFVPFARLFEGNPYEEVFSPVQIDERKKQGIVFKDDFPPLAPPGLMDAARKVVEDKRRGERQ